MQIAECYKILNVVPGEDWQNVRKSYHSLAKRFHPDVNVGKPGSQIIKINQAFEVLENYYKDEVLAEQQDPLNNVSSTKEEGVFSGLRTKLVTGRFLRAGLKFLVYLDAKAFQLDVKKDINLSKSVLEKGASINLKVGVEKFTVKVPLGDWNQMEYRLPCKGERSLFFKNRGDLVLNFIAPHKATTYFEKSRFYYEMVFSREQIFEGKVMTLNSSEGPIKFVLPRNIASGQKLTLRSRKKPRTLHILKIKLS